MRKIGLWAALTFSLAGFLVSDYVLAAGMRVLPLRLDINPKTRLATLELTNISSNDMGVQIDAKAWHQEAGKDVYNDTQDLFFAPPIFAIAAGKTKTVRFRLKRGADVNKELAYRIYAEQIAVPPGMGEPGAGLVGGVDVKLRFGIPLFVSAIQATPPTLASAFTRTESGSTALKLRNDGGAHLKIFSLQVLAEKDDTVLAETQQSSTETNYLLVGSESLWPLHMPAKPELAHLAAGTYRVRLKTDHYATPMRQGELFGNDGSLTIALTLAP